jgi:hypothetical protein
MKKILICTCFILLNNFLISQQTKNLKGFVRNSENQTLSFTTIYNIQTNQTISANEHGAFTLSASIGDSLILSRLSYQTDTFIITKEIFYEVLVFTIVLKRRNNLLKDVKVNGRIKNDSMARAFAEIMKRDTLLNNQKRKENMKQMAKTKINNNILDSTLIGISIDGLINTIWYKTSKKGKDNEKLLRLVSMYQQSLKIDDKLNTNYIIKVTGVDEKKAEWIKENCAKQALLKRSSFNEYDLILVLKECAQE